MLISPWRFEMLGLFRVQQAETLLTRFRTQKTAALLAFLAYFSQRSHAREEVAETLWSDQTPEAARNSLRVALASLRAQLEPPGTPSGSVLIADRTHIRLNPEALTCDAIEFEALVRSARRLAATAPARTISELQNAVSLYRGELLPGFYEEWVLAERERLANGHRNALRALTKLLIQSKERAQALDTTLRALAADPIDEEMHCLALRLYTAMGQQQEAARHYNAMERLLRDEMGVTPLPETRALAKQLLGLPSAGGRAVVADSLPVTAPPTADRSDALVLPARSRLPISFDRFFGREEETARLCALLAPNSFPRPLITLTGPGGNGKTRLAIEVGRTLAETYLNAVWFVSLADVTDPADISPAILKALALPRSPVLSPEEQIVGYMQSLPAALLILDNFEQLIEGGEEVVLALRERIATLAFLVTSRRPLTVGGEQEFPVSPLPFPTEAESPEGILRYPGVRLFVERARSARPDFALTERNAGDIARLCQLLEGIPLSIELAAARAMTLTPAQMLVQMEERFTFLTSRRKDVPARHRTLHATIEWSYCRLASEMQRLFVQLSVFHGGWTVEAATTICVEPDAAEYLERLCAHSLIRTREQGQVMRYQMLETLRLFAEEQASLFEIGPLGQRHAEYYQKLANQAAQHRLGPEETVWMDRLESEHDNLRAALRWYLQAVSQRSEQAENLLQLAADMGRFWETRGYLREGRQWLEQALHYAGDAPPSLRAFALNNVGLLTHRLGDLEQAQSYLQEALALRRAGEDRRGLVVALHNLGLVAIDLADYPLTLRCYEEAIPLWQELNEPNGLAISLSNLGRAYYEMEQSERAWALCMESLTLCRELDFDYGKAIALHALGFIAGDREQYSLAIQLATEALTLHEARHDARNAALLLALLGCLCTEQGDMEQGLTYLRAALDSVQALADQASMAIVLHGLARNMEKRGSQEIAVRLLGAEARLRAARRVPISPTQRRYGEFLREQLRTVLGDVRFEVEWKTGETLAPETLLASCLTSSLCEQDAT